MTYQQIRTAVTRRCASCAVAVVPRLAGAEPQPSSHALERAKDFIADEQWTRAIDVLKAAAADPTEPNKDEALFWLAHSLQPGPRPGAARSKRSAQLERDFPASRWVKPARSLRIEIAQKLRRNDVLWCTATSAAAAARAVPRRASRAAADAATGARAAAERHVHPRRRPRRRFRCRRVPHPPAAAAQPPAAATGATARSPPAWVLGGLGPDTDLRIQALGSLMRTDAPQRHPDAAGDRAREQRIRGEASRAVFVLAQSGRPDAHSTVVEVREDGPEPVQRRRRPRARPLRRPDGLGRAAAGLLHRQSAREIPGRDVARGARRDVPALLRIAAVGNRSAACAIPPSSRLARPAAATQLRALYAQGRRRVRSGRSSSGCSTRRAEDELIQIADQETDPALRGEVLARLRLLGTPKAKEYLEKVQTKSGNIRKHLRIPEPGPGVTRPLSRAPRAGCGR